MFTYVYKRNRTIPLPFHFFVVFLIAWLFVFPTHVCANTQAVQDLPQPAQHIAASINQIRADAGIHTLSPHPLLNRAAQIHANDMLAHAHYSHTGTDGSSVKDRVLRTGYALKGWTSENWVSVSAPHRAIPWWMNSYVHRNNILNTKWTEFGIGTGIRNGQHLFVVVFATGNTGIIPPVARPKSPAVSIKIPSRGLEYTVRPGDTLSKIARRYSVTWQALAEANSLSQNSILRIGQVIRLPDLAKKQEMVGTDKFIQNEADFEGDTYLYLSYTVQPGDTLSKIAVRYNASWQAIVHLNGLREGAVLQIGQALKVPSLKGVGGAAAESSPRQASQYHIVQYGDTMIGIANQYRLDWQHLLNLNGFSESTVLRIGQRIQLY